jgi:hypothetical protein
VEAGFDGGGAVSNDDSWWNVRVWMFAMLALSIVLCFLGWPETRIGLIVNAVLLAALLAIPDLAVR